MTNPAVLQRVLDQVVELTRELIEAGRPPSVILSHLRALREAGEPRRIRKLPEEIRRELETLIRDGVTIDAIVAQLRAMGAEVSRSAVGRFKQRFESQLERYREAQEVAGVWVAQLGENPKGDVGRLVAEMLKTVAFRTLAEMGDSEDPVGAMDIMLLAKAIKDLEGAAKLWAEREIKVRREVAAELKAKAEKTLDAMEDEPTDGPEDRAALLRRVREEVYGIFD